MAELRNPSAARWDWDRYLREEGGPGYFPRGISCADLDNETEINGRFLVLEGKRTGELLKGGQRYAMDARVRDGRTVIIVYGEPESGRIDFLQHWPNPEQHVGGWTELWQALREWAYWAETTPRPSERNCSFIPRFVAWDQPHLLESWLA